MLSRRVVFALLGPIVVGCSSNSAVTTAADAEVAESSDLEAEVLILGPPQPACDSFPQSRQVGVDLSNPTETSTMVFDQFTPTVTLSPATWSFDGYGLLFSPTADGAIGTVREPGLDGVLTFHASVEITFGAGDVSGGLLARADDPSQTGDIDRLEIRLDRASGQGTLVVTETHGGVDDATPFSQSLGAIDGTTSPYTLVVDTFDGTDLAISIPELAVAVKVPYPTDLPPTDGLYGLVAHANAGGSVKFRAWGICATSF
jgi:hypothetical protein